MSKIQTMYAKVRFTDASGTHEQGSKIEVPVESDAEKAECDTLVRYGVLTPNQPASDSALPHGDLPDTKEYDARDTSGKFAKEPKAK